jgi:hypothetical protein
MMRMRMMFPEKTLDLIKIYLHKESMKPAYRRLWMIANAWHIRNPSRSSRTYPGNQTESSRSSSRGNST